MWWIKIKVCGNLIECTNVHPGRFFGLHSPTPSTVRAGSFPCLESRKMQEPMIKTSTMQVNNLRTGRSLCSYQPMLTSLSSGSPLLWELTRREETHNQDLSYSGEGFPYGQILLFWFTQHFISQGWVLLPFSINTEAGTHDQELGLFRWRMIWRRFKNVSNKTQKHFVWSRWPDPSIQSWWMYVLEGLSVFIHPHLDQ